MKKLITIICIFFVYPFLFYGQNPDTITLKVVECSEFQDELYISKGWNWISFPKLPRANNDPYDAQTLLENLEPCPNDLVMTGRIPKKSIPNLIVKTSSLWLIEGLSTLQSTRGYKLMTSNSGTTVLPLTGTNLDPTHPVSIYSGENDDHENWVGYFLHETQDPFDALVNVMPALKSITGQYWAATNIGTQTHPYWITTPPYPLEYGDMLILTCYYDTQFSWNQPDNGSSSKTYVAPQEFTFEEQATYTPIFIELDTNNIPLEIGAFIGDSCVGGCVVAPEDTLVLVRGFIDGNDGDSITFQQYYGNKSTQKERVKAYYVYNVEKQRKEKRSIKTGENKDFYLVSFKPGGESSLMDRGEELSLAVYPNPAKEMLNLEYDLPVDAHISIEIFDLYGRLIAVPESGYQAGGYHLLQWNLKDQAGTKVKPGLYLVRLSCGNNTTAARVLVN